MLDVREYQLIQEENMRFRILVEPLPGKSVDRDRCEKMMQEQLCHYGLEKQLEVTVEPVKRLKNEGNQKFKRVLNMSSDQKKGLHRGSEVADAAKINPRGDR
jgi:hypothetical protein